MTDSRKNIFIKYIEKQLFKIVFPVLIILILFFCLVFSLFVASVVVYMGAGEKKNW